jgi:hypothetical protein
MQILKFETTTHGCVGMAHKPQGVKATPAYILDSVNKRLEVLRDELLNVLPPCKKVDHQIKLMPKTTPPSKAPYELNQKELEKV